MVCISVGLNFCWFAFFGLVLCSHEKQRNECRCEIRGFVVVVVVATGHKLSIMQLLFCDPFYHNFSRWHYSVDLQLPQKQTKDCHLVRHPRIVSHESNSCPAACQSTCKVLVCSEGVMETESKLFLAPLKGQHEHGLDIIQPTNEDNEE